MKNWLRSMLAVAALSIPAVGCTLQTAPTDGEGNAPSTEQAAEAQKGHLGKLAAASVDGKFSRWLLTPHGKIGGILLEDGSVVRVHGRAVKDTNLAAGDVIHVEGKSLATSVAPEGQTPVYVMASVKKGDAVIAEAPTFDGKHHGKHAWKHAGKHEGKHAGEVNADAPKVEGQTGEIAGKHHGKHAGKHHGKHAGWKKHGKHDLSSLAAVSSKGTVEVILAGHHGKAHAIVLSDGTVAYAPFKSDLAALGLKKGDAISVSGKGGEYPLGRALVLESIELPNGDVKTL